MLFRLRAGVIIFERVRKSRGKFSNDPVTYLTCVVDVSWAGLPTQPSILTPPIHPARRFFGGLASLTFEVLETWGFEVCMFLEMLSFLLDSRIP